MRNQNKISPCVSEKKQHPSGQGGIFKRHFFELEALAKIHKEPIFKDLNLEQEEGQATLTEVNSPWKNTAL